LKIAFGKFRSLFRLALVREHGAMRPDSSITYFARTTFRNEGKRFGCSTAAGS